MLTCVQLVQTIVHFEPISGIVNDEPIYPFDYSIGYYLVESAKVRFNATGNFHGYDPYFMAGYPEIYLENNHILVTVLASALSSFLSTARFIKYFYIICLACAPLAFFLTYRNFGVGKRGALAGTVLALTYIRVSEFVYTETGGSLCGMLIFLFGLPYLSFYYRFLSYGQRSSAFLFFVCTPLLAMLHKSFAVIMPIPLLVLFWLWRDRFTPVQLVFYGALAVVTCAANAFWIVPCIKGLVLMTQDPAPFWLTTNPLKIFMDYFTDRAGFFPVMLRGAYGTTLTRDLLLLLTVLGLRLVFRRGERRLFLFFTVSICWFLIFSYYGSFLKPLRQLEPYRYSIWMNFLMLVPASYYLDRFFSSLPENRVAHRRRLLGNIGLVAVVTLAFNLSPSCHRLIHLHPRRTVAAGYLDRFLELEQWISAHTTTSCRILIEDTYAPFLETRQGPYMDSYPLGILALSTKREFVSGRYPFYRISYRFASFSNGIAFGTSISTVDPDVFKRYLDLYNCGWVIACTKGSIASLATRFPFLKLEAEKGPFAIFRVIDPSGTYFVKGKGSIKATYEGIFLDELMPEDGEIIIKYHHVAGLRSDPPVEIEETSLSDDPHGFIKIYNPPSTVRLYYP